MSLLDRAKELNQQLQVVLRAQLELEQIVHRIEAELVDLKIEQLIQEA